MTETVAVSATTSDDPFLRRELRGPSLIAARGAAGALTALALILSVRGTPDALDRAHDRAQAAAAANGADWFVAASLIVWWIGIAAAIVWCVLAALILWRRSRDLFGILLALGFVAIGLILASPDQILIGGESAFTPRSDPWRELGRAITWILTAFAILWVFAFPDGRIVPTWAAAVMIPWAAWALLRIPFPEEFSHLNYGLAGRLLYIAFPVIAVASVIYRFARRSDAVQRQQLKWVVYGGVIGLAAWITVAVLPPLLDAFALSGAAGLPYRIASTGSLAAMAMLISVTIAIAIFRQGLLNIDLLINRTVMYSVLTVILVAAFVLLGALAQRAYVAVAGQQSDVVLFAVAVPIALAFLPLRARVQSIADRFLSDRTVLTIVFLDLAGSTARAAAVGDRAWRELLERYRSAVRREIRRYGGREIDTAGDGFFVTFGSPGDAIRFAGRAVAAVRPLGLEVRAGLHIGEVEVRGGHVTGIGVHIGARIVAAAGASEVLVSRTLRDLVAGSDLRFLDRGLHGLKGVPGRWHLYSVAPA